MLSPDAIVRTTIYAIILCWIVFAAIFLLRRMQPKEKESKRDSRAMLGMGLQGCGFWVVWVRLPRQSFGHAAFAAPTEIILGIFAVALAVGSLWLAIAALRALGKQWAVAARLIEGHHLITNGPYRFVRNPIYASMFGMMGATALATQRFLQLPVAVVVFVIGTVIRVRSEEKLLRSAFPREFEEYAQRVPALFPGIY
jgi:protein-S-isoprenylcysteine O-methyltransferase Ste14